MTLEQYAYLAEIIGVVVVVVTLIYLAVQVRQGAELLRSESRQAQITNDLNGVYKIVDQPEIARTFCRDDTPSFAEKTRLQFWIVGQMRAREHEWLQYRSGALDEDTWSRYRGVIFFLLGTTRAREHWNLCSPFFNAEFVAMVRDMMEGVPNIDFWEKLEAIR